ncbi:hypothetical protein C8R44DRAFT_818059 [Mycena epipterygia]|nr:hypothetical protein C8R44DRAFT_818059 [Mycena epipterygia]
MSATLDPLNVLPMEASLDGTLGAFEIGIVAGTFLFGIATLQAFNYYGDSSQDSRAVKSLVALLWSLELGHTISSLHGIYSLTVTSYGQPPVDIILKPPQSLPVTLLFSGGIVALVQVFFGNRIRVLSGRPHVFFLCIALAIIRLACDILLMSDFWIYNAGFSVLQSKEHWVVIASCTVSPVGDIVVAVSMSYCLWQLRKSEFNRTRSMADTLIIWTCETTLITSVAVMLQLILFLTRRDLAFMTLYFIQPKLFSNSMLAVLNGRSRFRVTGATTVDSQPVGFEYGGMRNRPEEGSSIMPAAVSVQISPTTEDCNYGAVRETGIACYAITLNGLVLLYVIPFL